MARPASRHFACATAARAKRSAGRRATGIFALGSRAESGLDAEHQADVLHGGARGALAEVVEPGDQHRCAVLLAAEHPQLHQVGVVERQRIEPLILDRRIDLDTFTHFAPA